MSENQSVAPFGGMRRAPACPNNITQRVREPVSRSKGRVVGYYASMKNKRPVAWESQLELRACMRFEFSPSVATYQEQPATIYFPARNRMCRYAPDFEVKTHSGETIFIEVKPFKRINNPTIKPILCAAAEFLAKEGAQYRVLTEHELIDDDLLRNLALIKPYLWQKLEDKEIALVINWLRKQGQITLVDFVVFVGSIKKAYAFIAMGFVFVDLKVPITFDVIILPTPENHYETCLFEGRFAPDFA